MNHVYLVYICKSCLLANRNVNVRYFVILNQLNKNLFLLFSVKFFNKISQTYLILHLGLILYFKFLSFCGQSDLFTLFVGIFILSKIWKCAKKKWNPQIFLKKFILYKKKMLTDKATVKSWNRILVRSALKA